jgi:ADP-heptose:LPS heptosyltransferase
MFLKKVDGVIGSLLARMWPRPKQVGRALPSASRLLLIRPGGIGDAVLLAPVIRRLREAFPGARIEVLAEKRNSGAFALCPDIDQVLCYDRPRELWAALSSGYDVVIDSEQWHRLSALVARMIRSKKEEVRGQVFTFN